MKQIIVIFICLAFFGCADEKDQTDIEGNWLQEGYGVYLEIADSVFRMYDVTEISCQPSSSASINSWTDSLSILLDLYKVVEVNSHSMVLQYGITSYNFQKLDAPLDKCQNPIVKSTDPKLNFDIFWHTFKENYAYSKIRNVDWDAIYKEHETLITKETTEVELFGYIGEILEAIEDEHISLTAPDSILNAYMAIRMQNAGIEESESASDPEIPTEKEPKYDNPKQEAMSRIADLFGGRKLQSYHKDLVKWGKLNEQVGYVQINSMNGYSSDLSIDDSLSHDDYWEMHWKQVFAAIEEGKTLGQYLRDEVMGARIVKDKILSDFEDMASLIIDLRFNPGGTDQVALELLSGFAQGGEQVFTKKVWYNGENTFDSPVRLPSSTAYYKGKVVLLTSHQTGSSAETFVLASRKFSKFEIVGSNTMGIFSDVLQKRLPNGWNYGLSNEIYEPEGGVNFEYIGIPPDHQIEYPKDWYQFHASIIELDTIDPAINLALQVLDK